MDRKEKSDALNRIGITRQELGYLQEALNATELKDGDLIDYVEAVARRFDGDQKVNFPVFAKFNPRAGALIAVVQGVLKKD